MILTLMIIGIIIGGMLTILSIVFMIISLAQGKNHNAISWAIVFVISVSILIYSLSQLLHRVVNKVKTSVEWMKEHENDSKWSYNSNDDETRKMDRQNWLDTLQAYNMDKYDGKVPADFYINKTAVKDSKGLITVPFIYPYSIRYNSLTGTGDLLMEGNDSVFVNNISQIAFDNNFAIIKVDNSQSPAMLKQNHADIEYLLYDMRTRNFEPAKNNEMLLDLGKRIGYTGSTQMNYLSEDYKGWIEYD